MIKRAKILILLFVVCFNCSIFENEQDYVIYPPNIIGEWIRTDFDGNISFYAPSQIDTAIVDEFITYHFYNDNTCRMLWNGTSDYYYTNCEWRINGEEPQIYLTLSFDLFDPVWPNLSFNDLYKIIELSDKNISLILITSNND